MKKHYYTLLFSMLFTATFGQTDYRQNDFQIPRQGQAKLNEAPEDFYPSLRNIEAPKPDGERYSDFLLRQKRAAQERYPATGVPFSYTKQGKTMGPQPLVQRGFAMQESRFEGRVITTYAGGIPNDDALAISNDGLLLTAVNSALYGYDLNTDTTIFDGYIVPLGVIGLQAGVGSGNFYDPKLHYDSEADRFVLVFLKDNDSINSRIIVAFSSTNDPRDPWNVYALPGNPLNSGRWTDFPAVNITHDEVFITANLIVPGVSWQVGFDGSVIWQLDKQAGYDNAGNLPARLYSDIRYNGRYIRNLHCVNSTEGVSDVQYFMSNRNFDISNDTLFLLKIEGTAGDPQTQLEINYGLATTNYGVPPNARQLYSDTNNSASGLQTNDGRVLGALTNGDWIQFTSTSMNPATGLAAVFYGRIEQPLDFSAPFTADTRLLGDDTLDFGYPNLVFTGNEACDDEVLIGFNFASPTDFPGYGFIYKENRGDFQPFKRVVDGETTTDRQAGAAERWGDYFGIQRKYNEPGKVWMSGYFTYDQGTRGVNATWISEVQTLDSSRLEVQVTAAGNPSFGTGILEVQAFGGSGPYTLVVDGDTAVGMTISDLAVGDTVRFDVIDALGCVYSEQRIIEKTASNQAGIFPNPAKTRMISQFELERGGAVRAIIFDMRGNEVAQLMEANAGVGLNELQFELSPLQAGRYQLVIFQGDEEVYSEAFVKIEY